MFSLCLCGLSICDGLDLSWVWVSAGTWLLSSYSPVWISDVDNKWMDSVSEDVLLLRKRRCYYHTFTPRARGAQMSSLLLLVLTVSLLVQL